MSIAVARDYLTSGRSRAADALFVLVYEIRRWWLGSTRLQPVNSGTGCSKSPMGAWHRKLMYAEVQRVSHSAQITCNNPAMRCRDLR